MFDSCLSSFMDNIIPAFGRNHSIKISYRVININNLLINSYSTYYYSLI